MTRPVDEVSRFHCEQSSSPNHPKILLAMLRFSPIHFGGIGQCSEVLNVLNCLRQMIISNLISDC